MIFKICLLFNLFCPIPKEGMNDLKTKTSFMIMRENMNFYELFKSGR